MLARHVVNEAGARIESNPWRRKDPARAWAPCRVQALGEQLKERRGVLICRIGYTGPLGGGGDGLIVEMEMQNCR